MPATLTERPTHIPLGNKYQLDELDYGRRSPAQRETIIAIITADDFDFATANPLSMWMCRAAYQGPFWFMYYTKDGVCHSVQIYKNGTVARSISVEE